MKLPRRNFLHLAAGAVALPAVSRIARADTYPSRPVRLVVGFPAAFGADITARLMGQWLSERLGQQFVIENRPGAGTNIGTEVIVRAAPDGYSLLISHSNERNQCITLRKSQLQLHQGYRTDCEHWQFVMMMNPSVPVKTVSEFIAYAKANPSKINMASSGPGTFPHVAGELFKVMADVSPTYS